VVNKSIHQSKPRLPSHSKSYYIFRLTALRATYSSLLSQVAIIQIKLTMHMRSSYIFTTFLIVNDPPRADIPSSYAPLYLVLPFSPPCFFILSHLPYSDRWTSHCSFSHWPPLKKVRWRTIYLPCIFLLSVACNWFFQKQYPSTSFCPWKSTWLSADILNVFSLLLLIRSGPSPKPSPPYRYNLFPRSC
jgi:hypothetical protein